MKRFSFHFAVLLLAAFCLLRAGVTNAQPEGTEQKRDFQRESRARLRFHELALAEKRAAEGLKRPAFLRKFRLRYSAVEGFDRNVKLDDTHKSSLYTQQDFSIDYTEKWRDLIILRPRYHLRYTNYYKFASENIFSQDLGVDLRAKLHPRLYSESEYEFTIWKYPNNAQGTFYRNEVKTGLRHWVIENRLYHKPSYIFQHKDYPKRKARTANTAAIIPGPDDREDTTNRWDYEIGFYPYNRLLLRVNQQWGRSDSNDAFRDFYDYTLYRTGANVSWQIRDPLTLNLTFYFQRNNYDERDVTGIAAYEDIYYLSSGLYYRLHRNVTVGTTASYLKNDSNSPTLEYQDAIFTAGLYFTV